MPSTEHKISRALVLAAGDGTRMGDHSPKPILDMVGLPLLARTLLSLERAGITDAFVVLGFEADAVRAVIEQVATLKLRVHWLYNGLWEEPNGLSVLAAESVLDGPFILTMCDHVIDPKIVARLQEKADGFRGIDLAVDYDVDRVFDLDDATKVKVSSDRIVHIGKYLTEFNAVDTGVFLASPALFDAVKAAQQDGDASLSSAVQKLADREMARVTDIGDLMWQDVDTPRDAREAQRKLLASARKSSDGPIARSLNRPISLALSKRLAGTGVTPNHVTFANLLLGVASGAVAALGGYTAFLVAAILFHLSSVFDGSDGELAKLTFRTSKRGEWFDTVSDNITYLACLVGLTIGVTQGSLPGIFFISGVVGFVFALGAFVNLYIYLLRRKKSGSLLAVQHGFERGNGPVARVIRILQYLTKRDVFAFLMLVLAIVGQLPLALPFFAIATSVVFISSIRLNVVKQPKPAAAAEESDLAEVTTLQWVTGKRRKTASETVNG